MTRHGARTRSRHGVAQATRAAVTLLLASALGGCAVAIPDGQGGRRIIGLGVTTIRGPEARHAAFGACMNGSAVETFGLLIYRDEVGAGLGLGHVEHRVTVYDACPEAAEGAQADKKPIQEQGGPG